MTWAEALPTIATIGAALAGLWFIVRNGGGAALGELERANRVLERRVTELTAQNGRQAAEIAALQTKTDVSLALAPLIEALQRHETEAERRTAALIRQSDGVLDVLDMIATRLGPEPRAA